MTTLLDLGDYPHIQTDGMADVYMGHQQAYLVLFRWKKVDGLFRPLVVGTVSIPLDVISPMPRMQQLVGLALQEPPQPVGNGVH